MQRNIKIRRLWLASAVGLLAAHAVSPLSAAEPGTARGAFVEEVRNDQAPFYVRVDVDQASRVYRVGDTMGVTVKSAREGYLYLFYFMADGKINCLFPNQYQTDNRIPAGQLIVVPKQDAEFRIRIGPPCGAEILKAVVSLEPLTSLDIRQLTRNQMTEVGIKSIRGAYVDQLKPDPKKWAEHDVQITTVEVDRGVPLEKVVREFRGPERKVGVFVGTRIFSDKRIRRLSATDRDAVEMEKALRQFCNLDKTFVLLNEQATLGAVHDLICKEVPAITSPGDTVIIYISTHGSRCADDDGDEEDGYDEFLALYHTKLDNLDTIRESALVDDAFGHWLQRLDGRKIIVLLDACHSAGQAEEKGLAAEQAILPAVEFGKGFTLPGVNDTGCFAFLDGELPRVRDIGQRETAVLAASDSAQIAFERRDRTLSVMTHFLLEYLRENESATLSGAYQHLQLVVPMFVARQFSGRVQTPMFFNELSGEFDFRAPLPE